MNKQFSIAEAKNKLPLLIHEVEHGPPATITRHGSPVAVVLSIQQYEAMANKPKKDLWGAIIRFRRSLRMETGEFTDTDFSDLRDKSSGREIGL